MTKEELIDFFNKFTKEELDIILNRMFFKGHVHAKEFSAFLEVYEKLNVKKEYTIEFSIENILLSIKEKIKYISDIELDFFSTLVDEEPINEELPKGWYYGDPEDYDEFYYDNFEIFAIEEELEATSSLGEYLHDEKKRREHKVLKLNSEKKEK